MRLLEIGEFLTPISKGGREMPADFDKIHKCGLVKILGVTECNNCEHLAECWGQEAILPEPKTDKGMKNIQKALKDNHTPSR